MTLRLSDLHACFEGVIPSIVATHAPGGLPNISYLSHVVQVDAAHVALSNQFFGKTARNLQANPRATILLVDGRNGAQFRLEATLVRSETAGPLFDQVAGHLRASSEQVGMAAIMRLKAVDIFRVTSLAAVPSPHPVTPDAAPPGLSRLQQIARAAEAIAAAPDLATLTEAVLDAVLEETGCEAASLALHDAARAVVTTIGSRGYPQSGIGSELALGSGLAGRACAEGRLAKVSDLSRIRRLGAAIRATTLAENESRTIPAPGLPGALSQIAVPLIAQDRLLGVLLAESRQRFAFDPASEAALTILARQAAAAIALVETRPAEPAAPSACPRPSTPSGAAFKVVHYGFDDSVFIDDAYIIKGVAGRLLIHLLDQHVALGRTDFTNREIRLSDVLRLPEWKDNLETRLLLLQRRLDEKATPVRLLRPGRGRIRLELDGRPDIQTA